MAVLYLSVCVVFLTHCALGNSPPTITVKAPAIPIREDTPVGSRLFGVNATDVDGDTLTFLPIDPVTSELVVLVNKTVIGNTKTADVQLIKQLDRDYEPAQRILKFYVKDLYYTSSATVTVIITDVNDEPPKFDEPGYRISVKESVSVDTQVGVAKALDPDTGSGGNVFYGLVPKGQNPGDYLYTFRIESSLKKGYVYVNQTLDYEDRTFYQYNVTTWDNNEDEDHPGNNKGVPVDYFITVLDVQDTPPFFRNLPYIRTIDENAIRGTSVIGILAEDGDLGVPNQISYSFEEGNSDSNNFTINASNGTIVTSQLLDADSPEMKLKGGVLSFIVNASEIEKPGEEQLGNTSTTTTVTINIRDVNDNVPTFSPAYITASVYENTPIGVPLTLTVPVEVVDIDMMAENNLFVLSVLDDSGAPYSDFDTIPATSQPVSQTNIMIRVQNKTLLDYEQRTNVTFKILAHEYQSAEKFNTTVNVVVNIINMNDNSPIFENSTYHFKIREDASVDDLVGQVVAKDADVGSFGEVTYVFENANDKFDINSDDGSITVINGLDREDVPSYSITVQAHDNDPEGTRTGQARAIIELIDVNDNAPAFVGSVLTIPLAEDVDIGTVVTRVSAVDADEGENAEIEYFLSDEHNATGRFEINKTSGTVTVAQSLVGLSGVRVITLEARDKGTPALSGYQDLVFSISDVNLNAPQFQTPSGDFNAINRYILRIDEEQDQDSLIFTFFANDSDSGDNGQVYYGIDPGPDSGFFRINHTTGRLSNNARLDRENPLRSDPVHYYISVYVSDGGTPSLKSTIPVTVTLVDIDDNDPYFEDKELTVHVQEETVGCHDDNVDVAEDRDQYERDRCYYIKAVDAAQAGTFSLNRTTGEVCLLQKIDRETSPLVNMLVKVSKDCSLQDTPNNQFDPNYNKTDTSLLHVKVNVLDINDNPPVFNSNGKLSTGILFDTGIGQIVFNLREEVTDADEGINAIANFTDLGQTGSDIDDIGDGVFEILTNGSIKTKRLFSATMLGYVEILVEARDIGGLTARATLKIYIISNAQRVKIIFNSEPNEVQQIKDNFTRELEQFLDYKIVVEKITQHRLGDQSTVAGRTDMFIHGIYPSGEFVPATEIWRDFDFKTEISIVFGKYRVTETQPIVDSSEQDDSLSRSLTTWLVLVAIVLSLIVFSLAISLYCVRTKYMRRLRAETTKAVPKYEEKPHPPGTNLYTASNPVFMRKEPSPGNEDTDSMNLDDNAVDDNDNASYASLDEQELVVTIDDGPYEALRTMRKNTVLESVLQQHEAQVARMKEDKQSLVEDKSTDGDSGTFMMKSLEHTDI